MNSHSKRLQEITKLELLKQHIYELNLEVGLKQSTIDDFENAIAERLRAIEKSAGIDRRKTHFGYVEEHLKTNHLSDDDYDDDDYEETLNEMEW